MLRAATVFLSAFLLFEVQPIVARTILPWFGGAPAVWTACMLFFQTLLLAGYALAHAAVRALPVRMQGALQLALAAGALAFLPIAPAAAAVTAGSGTPCSTWSSCSRAVALLPRPRREHATAAVVGSTSTRRLVALSPLRALQRRLAARAARVSPRRRAVAHDAGAGDRLVRGVLRVRADERARRRSRRSQGPSR